MTEVDPNNLLQITLASIGDAVIATDAEGRVTFLNPVAEQLTGWPAGEASGRPLVEVFKIINEHTRGSVENPVEKVLASGQIVGLANHTILIARDGSERPIDDSAAPIRGADGRLRGVVLVFRDITERKRAEAAADERHRITALRADISMYLAQDRPVNAGLQACCEALVRHLGMAFARAWTLNEATDVLELQASAGLYTHLDGPHCKVKVGEFKIGRIAKNRQPHLTNDVPHDPNVSDQPWATREGMIAFAGYPLIVADRVLGVLAMFARQPLTETLLDDLAPLSDQIAQYIERKRADERLRESEFRYRLIGQAANDAIWDWDLLSNQVTWSEGIQACFGYASEQIGADATWWVEQMHPADRERVTHDIHAVIDGGGELWESEYRYRRADGAYAVVFDRGRVVRDDTGRPVRMVGSMLDMTDRKQSEDALKFQLDLTQSITDNATTAIFMMDDNSRCTFMNPAAEKLTGFSFSEMRGGVLHDFIHHHRADGSAYPVSECPLDRALPAQIEVRNHADLFFRKNGESFPVICNARVIFKEGIAIGTVIEVRDVTAEWHAAEATRRRSEQLRRLADVGTRIGVAHDVASVMGIVTEEVRHVIESHQSVASMTVDANWAQAITAVSLSEKYDAWKNYDRPPDGSGIYSLVCRSNKPFRLTQSQLEAHPGFRQLGPDAANHPPMRGWLAAPFIGRDGRNLGLIQLSDKCDGEFTDDDESVLVQLAQMASVAIENAGLVESLRDADRRKDEFLATLAHELRNPLAPIRLGLEVMKHSSDAETLEQIRATMERQTQQLITLVDDLLDVSRITQRKLELRKCRVSLADVVRSAVEASRPFVEEAGHELTVAIPDRPLLMLADPHRLAQVISNLLNNAAKYTPENGRIRLSAERRDRDVLIAVKDDGIGIPPEMQQRVFEMFAQIDRPMEKGYTGLGIGLTLVKSLVHMHGGEVSVSSDGPGLGSEFVVRLPLLIESDDDARQVSAQKQQLDSKERKRVLVVDDNKAAADMLGLVVKMLGHEIRTANDGRQAIEVAAEYLPEVVLMDVGMPKMSGHEAARHLRAQPWGEKMLLIALTGWGQEEDKRLTKEAGFDHHLVKPADPADLQRLLSDARSTS